MRGAIFTVVALLLCVGILFTAEPLHITTLGLDAPQLMSEYGHDPDNPPPLDSLCLVFAGVDYGGNFNSPQGYPNAKHITNVSVGSYFFPVVLWQMGVSWDEQCVFSFWDDLFKFWSYPDSHSTSTGFYTGRTGVCADSKGDLHFTWYQRGNPDDYEIFYTRAFLDTSAGVIQYTVDRPGVMVSETNGEFDRFSSIAIYEDTLVMIVWTKGDPPNAVCYNYSTDGGDNWVGAASAYEHGAPMPSGWQLHCVAPDPNTGDMWVTVPWDYTGDGSQDIVAYHWHAQSNTWTDELIATATSLHPYAVPAVAVDYNSVPHVIFQENLAVDGGVNGTLSGWNGCGPAGTLFYTHRQGGTWHTPVKIMFPRYEYCNYEAGYPSVGVASDNTIYFTCTQPESASSDTGAYLPFHAYYGEISPYTGAVSYGGRVSSNDSANAIYPQITYHVPIGGEVPPAMQGPGITWSQLINAVPPADIFYNHSDTLLGIAEDEKTMQPQFLLCQNLPNPFSDKTVIRFSIEQRAEGNLTIYNVAGRKVREWHLAPSHSSLVTGLVWDGKDLHGDDVPGGIYLYTLTNGTYSETKKLILLR